MTKPEYRKNAQSPITNTQSALLDIAHWRFFRDSGLRIRNSQEGITLLLVVVLLSAILSISVGIFNVVYGEFRISGEVADSFRALYAADEGIERTLYRDRQDGALCVIAEGPDCFVAVNIPVLSGGQYSVRVSKAEGQTAIVVAGQSREGTDAARIIKRGFQITY